MILNNLKQKHYNYNLKSVIITISTLRINNKMLDLLILKVIKSFLNYSKADF